VGGAPYHVPVLVEAVVDLMKGTPPGPLVDGTLGGGGHAVALADALGDGWPIVGVDRDPDALAAAGERLGGRSRALVRGDFRHLRGLLAEVLGPAPRVSGILLDLGVSSWQLDTEARGFAIKHPDGPLDMRMDPTDEATPTARDLLEGAPESELAALLRDLGEVKQPRLVARRLKAAVAEGRLVTTGDLAREVEAVQKPTRGRAIHPATQVFQALRVAVNDELGALEQVLADAPDLLVAGGRMVVIAYHSLEDRRVKQAFRLGERGPERPRGLPHPSGWRPTWRTLTRRPISATEAEVAANPRARSARLRAAERVTGGVAR